ncbi:MAG: hypothetical protein JWP44_4526 [Mucilaginibacter sp.]|nr:hypothetical protein [Mucilaginibacter sp.]
MRREQFDSLQVGDRVWWSLQHYTVAGINRDSRKLLMTRTDQDGTLHCTDWLRADQVAVASNGRTLR